MKIGIVSPFQPREVADLLDADSRARIAAIQGVTATPVTPLVRAWLGRGHSLSLFCLDPSVSRVHTLGGERLTLHVIPKRRARSCLLDCYRAECRLVRELVRREKPDVLTAQWTYDHALAALQCGIPTAVTCHDTPWRYAWINKSWFTTYHLAVAWRVIRHAHRLVCVSPYTARHIQNYFWPRCPVDVVPNGVPPEVFQRRERRLQTLAKPERALTVCNVGGWGGLKNVATLLQAFGLVRAKLPAARLVLFGRDLGPAQAAETWARGRQLHHGVVFQGSVPYGQVLDFLETDAGLMAHPSLVETHGLVLVEAMACGVPVIGGLHSGAVPWTLEDGRSGYLCDVRHPRALAETILQAVRAPDGNQALVEHAWASAARRFNQEQAVTGNEAILQQLCAAHAEH
ncbi:MAG TPA: glycosyltransferase family 4 protein [Candidatus Acidoferrales bacterium]|nr:glycosyltransferase family 4 protein [Candidatus Acidoferrales bacterium]